MYHAGRLQNEVRANKVSGKNDRVRISWHGAAIFYVPPTRNIGNNAGVITSQESKADVQSLFFYHIVCNNITQDVYAVSCLLDAVFARLTIELPSVKYIDILSDNATCYQNDMLPAVAPFIAKEHNLKLQTFVHSETQRGKSLIDAHFALAMMHVNRFCNESRRDVTTPGDVVVAPTSVGGVANCTAELVNIDRENTQMQLWIDAYRTKKLSRLGRVNEIAYKEWEGEEITALCFTFSFHNAISYRIGMHSMKSINGKNNNGEEIPELDMDEGEIEDANSASNESRQHDYIYKSKVTGVAVYSRKSIRKQMKRRTKTSQWNSASNILGETTDFLIFQGTIDCHEGDENKNTVDPVMLECTKCHALYRRKDAFDKHSSGCSGIQSKCIKERACRMALAMIGTSETPIYSSKEQDPRTTAIRIEQGTRERFSFLKGWAQRPRYGRTLGNNTAQLFKEELRKFLKDGQLDKGRKMSASRMREALEAKHSNRYDIPSEQSIIYSISSLVRKHKKFIQDQLNDRQNGHHAGSSSTTSRCARIPGYICEKLIAFVGADPGLMPRHAWKLFLDSLQLSQDRLPEGFPSESTIRGKVSALKSKQRTARHLNTSSQG